MNFSIPEVLHSSLFDFYFFTDTPLRQDLSDPSCMLL